MNGMPVGVVMIEKENMNITYKNKSIFKLFKKLLNIDLKYSDDSILNQLTFKIIDMGSKSL